MASGEPESCGTIIFGDYNTYTFIYITPVVLSSVLLVSYTIDLGTICPTPVFKCTQWVCTCDCKENKCCYAYDNKHKCISSTYNDKYCSWWSLTGWTNCIDLGQILI